MASNTTNIDQWEIPATMHGVQLVKYGSPKESLLYNEETPVPQIKTDTQVLIRNKAASVNPGEAKCAGGFIKIVTFPMKLPCVIGGDFAGVIVAKGDKVADFEVGDEVFGTQPFPFFVDGTYAQYTVVNTSTGSIAKKPKDLSFDQAASAGIAVLTAYQGIVNIGRITDDNIHEKRKIIVVGASGGVGSYGVQIAKAINAENTVVGICSGKNAAFVRSLGADVVVDYKDELAYKEFIETTEKGSFDIVFDCVGGDDYFGRLDPLLKKNGVYSSAVGPVEHVYSSSVGLSTVFSMMAKVGYKKIFAPHRYEMVGALPHKEFPTKIAPLFTNKKIVGPLYNASSIFPLKDIHQAYEKINSHRAVGKIILSID